MTTFHSFSEVANGWRSKYRVEKVQLEALEAATNHLQLAIKFKYGTTGPANSPLTLALKGGGAPLIDTGLLRASVFRMIIGSKGEVWQGIDWLGRIQEYGAVFAITDKQRKWIFAQLNKYGLGGEGGGGGSGMIRIPPRPIWRNALQENRLYIYKLASDTMKKYLTN